MYSLIKIPSFASKNIYTFSKEEAKEYYKWFKSIKNDRVQILKSDVQKIYPEWKADYSRNSLIKLYEWFESKVTNRKMINEEREEIEKQVNETTLLVGVVEIPETTLTDETVSICFDIGIYLGDVVIFNIDGTKWLQKISSINYIDYAQPLIATKNSKVPFNPRRIAESMAGSILDKSEKLFSFIELYDDLVIKFSKL